MMHRQGQIVHRLLFMSQKLVRACKTQSSSMMPHSQGVVSDTKEETNKRDMLYARKIFSLPGQKQLFKECCLVDSFRAMGLKVPYSGNGPFFVLEGGRAMIASLGHLGTHWLHWALHQLHDLKGPTM